MGGNKVTISKDNRPGRAKKWLVRWYGEYEPATGNQRRYCQSFKTRAQAERFQIQKQIELEDGPRDPKVVTIKDLSDQFLDSRQHNLRHATIRGYKYTIAQLLEFFSPATKIHKITRQQAEKFISTREIIHPDHQRSGKQLSSWGRNGHLSRSHALFSAALDWEYLKKNPFSGIKPVKAINRDWHYFTSEEFQALLTKTPNLRLRCFLAVLYGTGLRYGETINLLWNGRDIDIDRGKINVKNRLATVEIPPFHVKDHESRSLPLPSWVSNMLIELQAQSSPGCPFVFLTPRRWETVQEKWTKMRRAGGGYRWQNRDVCNNMLRSFKSFCRKAGISSSDEKLTLHCLRKSYAQTLADAGTPISTLKKLMGHSSIRTTEEYYLKSTDANEERAGQVMEEVVTTSCLPNKSS